LKVVEVIESLILTIINIKLTKGYFA